MQRIVQQLASVSYSPFPALCAPHIAGLLPAPQISGLLGSGVVSLSPSRLSQQRAVWAAADKELSDFLAGARDRLLSLRAELMPVYPLSSAEGQVCHA